MFKNKYFLIAMAVILLTVIGLSVYSAEAAYTRPLAAPLKILVDAAATPQPTQVPTPATVCGQSGVITILFLSRDKSNGTWPYGADLIRFVRVDFSNKTVRLIAVPRDLWVATPHLNNLKLDHSRLGLVYYRVEQNTTGTTTEITTAATNAVAQALYDNYGVTADHYIFFEMRYFAQAIDQLGGLDVNVPADISAGEYSFHAGEQHLDGTNALLYARLLPGNELSAGWNRMDRQNLILKALIAKLLEPANIVKIPDLINQFKQDITTDLSPELITNLACLAGQVPQDQITTTQVDQSMILGAGPDTSMIADTAKVTQFLHDQLAP